MTLDKRLPGSPLAIDVEESAHYRISAAIKKGSWIEVLPLQIRQAHFSCAIPPV
jgi:hypothetical protein